MAKTWPLRFFNFVLVCLGFFNEMSNTRETVLSVIYKLYRFYFSPEIQTRPQQRFSSARTDGKNLFFIIGRLQSQDMFLTTAPTR